MVAKCSNPQCNRQFRHLSKGRLFLLPPSAELADSVWKVDRLADYCYWLCPECSQEYTIARVGAELLFSRKEQNGTPQTRSSPDVPGRDLGSTLPAAS